MALRHKMKAELPYLRLKFLEIDYNQQEKALFKKKWSRIVDTIFFENDFNNWDGKNEKINEVVKNTDAYKKNYGNIIKRYPCDRLWYMLAIQWNGKVSPCMADWDGKNSIGDLSTSTIREIWYSYALQEYRRKHLDQAYDSIELCRLCTRWGTRNMGDWLSKHREKALSIPFIEKSCK